MRIVVDERSFRRYEQSLNQRLLTATTIAAQQTAASARASTSDYHIQELIGSIAATPARFSKRGFAAIVFIRDGKGLMFEKGTYRKLGARQSTRGRTSAATGNRGVKPQRILRKQVPTARAFLFAQVRRVV